jgi:hypothetical protein
VSVCVGAVVSVFSFSFCVSFGFAVAVVSVADVLVLLAAVVLDESAGGGSVDVRSPSLSGGRVSVRAGGAVVVRVRDQRIPSDGVTYGCCCCGATSVRRAGGGVCP